LGIQYSNISPESLHNLEREIPSATNENTLYQNYKYINKFVDEDEDMSPLVIKHDEEDIAEDIFSPNTLNTLQAEVIYIEFRLGEMNRESLYNNSDITRIQQKIADYNYLLSQLHNHYSAVDK
jgi:hypothetical protein